ncbi:MAG: hypothetical protein AAF561_14385, partial [Planctomycetota bacterium]
MTTHLSSNSSRLLVIALLIGVFGFVGQALASDFRSEISRGDDARKEERYTDALSAYKKAGEAAKSDTDR